MAPLATSRAAASVAIHATALEKSYRSGKVDTVVLRGLSLEIGLGELTLVSGPSGCGKSTLLSLLGGLLQPDAGRVHALGVDLWSLAPSDLERFRLEHTGFVFQGFNLFGALTALEQVMLPLGYLGLDRATARARAQEALAEVDLTDRIDLRPSALSGGEKQRVAIARALAKQPQLLFADEPTSALDAASGQRVIEILHRSARRHGCAVLCVSHDPRLIGQSDRVLQMEDGRILTDRRQPEYKEPVA
ncbi:MAG: ABC transporter ATP-binding protein [Proteobacteria bacterium]|nr:ABC transporter ATP-binding protein [Pseudomonadota bacterium]